MPSSELALVRKHWEDLVAALAPPAGIPEYRVGFDELCGAFPIPPDAAISRVDAGGVPGLLVATPQAQGTRTILWMHSGGYVFGSAHGYRAFAAALSRASRARVLVIDYRLAPEHQYPAALEDATTAYRWLLAQGVTPGDVVIGGDSAGGGLALATVLALRDAGDPRPVAAVAVSPVADQTFSGESMHTRASSDPIASAEMLAGLCGLYRGSASETDPYVSPLFGDFAGAPPLLVLVGTEEVLHDDATRLVDKARADGASARLVVGEGQFHIWPLFAGILPEGQQAIDTIGQFINEVR
jgi:monoterpene epsilon-lactone hydrolase